jgi:hypothetical protein
MKAKMDRLTSIANTPTDSRAMRYAGRAIEVESEELAALSIKSRTAQSDNQYRSEVKPGMLMIGLAYCAGSSALYLLAKACPKRSVP